LGRQHHDLLSLGGQGGKGGDGGVEGGSGGAGEGPTVNYDIKAVESFSTNMYVGEASPVPFPKVLSQQRFPVEDLL
jgi:hypothetical protein